MIDICFSFHFLKLTFQKHWQFGLLSTQRCYDLYFFLFSISPVALESYRWESGPQGSFCERSIFFFFLLPFFLVPPEVALSLVYLNSFRHVRKRDVKVRRPLLGRSSTIALDPNGACTFPSTIDTDDLKA